MKNTTRLAFWLVLSAVMLSVSYVATVSGMIGGWDVHVFGITHAAIWDPGGMYVGNGLLLLDEPTPPYVGHPGLTLNVLCHAVAKTLFWLSGSPGSFQHFAGTHIHRVILTEMLTTTAVWLVAFGVLERVAVRVLENEALATIAVVAFATTYPVLYYMNRVSPEALLVVFTLLAFLWLWRYYELRESSAALAFLALSAQAAVAAFYTKLLIVGPIVLFIPFQLLCRRGVRRSRAVRDAALFLLFAAPALALGSRAMDWGRFFSYWFEYAPGAPRYAPSNSWLVNVGANMGATAWAMLSASLAHLFSPALIPSFDTREGLFFSAEALFLLIAIAGLILYWRSCANRPVLLAWFLGFIALTSIPYLQRGLSAWHYTFLQLAAASIFFSYGLARLIHRVTGAVPATGTGWALCCGAVVFVHALAAVLFVDMQRYNASQYGAFWKAFYQAPALLGDGGRIGLARTKVMPDIMQPLMPYLPKKGFLVEYERLFARVLPEATDEELRARGIELVLEEGADRTLTLRRVPGASR